MSHTAYDTSLDQLLTEQTTELDLPALAELQANDISAWFSGRQVLDRVS